VDAAGVVDDEAMVDGSGEASYTGADGVATEGGFSFSVQVQPYSYTGVANLGRAPTSTISASRSAAPFCAAPSPSPACCTTITHATACHTSSLACNLVHDVHSRRPRRDAGTHVLDAATCGDAGTDTLDTATCRDPLAKRARRNAYDALIVEAGARPRLATPV
jgi:hypothetical protein